MKNPSVSLVVVVAAVGLLVAGQAQAVDLAGLRERLAQARAERVERLAELREELQTPADEESGQAGEDGSNVELGGEEAPAGDCECSARLKLTEADLRWGPNGLVFLPKFDVRVKVRDERPNERWNLRLDWAAASEFADHDEISVPGKVAAGGTKSWEGQCVDTRLSHNSVQGEPMSLGQLARSLFGDDVEVMGEVKMRARLSGCDTQELFEAFDFEIGEFGSFDIGRWGRAR